jgi:lipopolysaccharide/colanic/teichoic acid biosynthesis glycosyltransferase
MSGSDGVGRVFDVAVSGTLLAALSPVCCGIALAIRCDSRGPILHRAIRMGRHGRPFTLYKFRTMVPGAAAVGPRITAASDTRVTRVGRFLRKTKLDELPQLWNVVRGDMSLVGPRPEDPRFLPYYQAEHQLVLSVRPGITGPSQLAFFNEEELLSPADPEGSYVRDVLPRKLDIDLQYAREHRLGQNVSILMRTFAAAVQRGMRELSAG